jgi:hypothetical protein
VGLVGLAARQHLLGLAILQQLVVQIPMVLVMPLRQMAQVPKLLVPVLKSMSSVNTLRGATTISNSR